MAAAPLAIALQLAARTVAAVIGGRAVDDALASVAPDASLRPAVQDLAYGALRRFGRGDFWLSRLMARPLADASIRGLLLAALYRIDVRPEDAHTTVDQAVTAAAGIARGKYKALVNGVLRNALRRAPELEAAARTNQEAYWQHPRWWLDRLRAQYPEAWQTIAEAGNERPPMTLRVNRRRSNALEYQAELAVAEISASVLDDTAVKLDKPASVDRLPGFGSGRVSVQDWGAQRAALLLDAQPGMRVLDACAAPGGKTAHVLERADLDLVALDLDAARATRVKSNLDRLGLSASVFAEDCIRLDRWWDECHFDRILADVPCSASGVVRRHPDIKWLRRPSDIDTLARRQRDIIDALWKVLAPGGRLLYATCSLFAEENGAQMDAFVERHEDAQRLPTFENNAEWQLTPNADHDGFYYALLGKRS